MSILKHYKYPTFRIGHKELLEFVEKNLHMYDVFLIVAPTGSGKTELRQALASYLGKSAMLVPTNPLLHQERLDYPNTAAMFGKETKYYNSSSEDFDYYEDLRTIKSALSEGRPTLTTYYGLLAHHLQTENLLIDEGHGLLKFNAELSAKKLWRKKAKFPPNIYSRKDLETWLQSDEAAATLSDKGRKDWLKKIETNDYMIERGTEFLNGKAEDLIKLVPISPGLHYSLKKNLKRLFLFSATIHEMDVEDLKVGRGGRVVTIRLPSPIPKERRPLIRDCVGSVNYHNMPESCREIAKKLRGRETEHPDKLGLVHVTYGMAIELSKTLGNDQRFIFHNKFTGKDMLKLWQEGPMGKIFIAAGFSEGLDLKGEKFFWQDICKIAWPSLADQTIKKRADRSEKWYIWNTLRDFLQRYGRICRGEFDYGETRVLDSSMDRLYTLAVKYDLWPAYMPEWHGSSKESFRR